MADLQKVNPAVYELEVNADGTLNLPSEVRDRMGLQAGDTITLIESEDSLYIIPTMLLVPEFAEYMAALLKENDLTVSDLVSSKSEREKLFRERYGHLTAD